MICTECGDAEATGMRDIAIVALPDGPAQHSIQHLCQNCYAKISAIEAREHAVIQERVRVDFANGSAFTQIRAQLALVIARAREDELAEAAEYLDLVAKEQPTPLPHDLQTFADRYRPANPSAWYSKPS